MTRLVSFHIRSRATWAAAVLAFALAASGCGGDDEGSTAPADDQQTVEAVVKKIEVAAGRIANNTPDRNLPGPYTFKAVCLSPDEALKFGTTRDAVQCHIEAFTRKNAYVWSEDWRVPVQDGQPGEPEIVGEYRIRNFLRKDNRLNCSGGETPQERCTGEYLQPSDQSGIQPGATPPPTDGQQEVPIQP